MFKLAHRKRLKECEGYTLSHASKRDEEECTKILALKTRQIQFCKTFLFSNRT